MPQHPPIIAAPASRLKRRNLPSIPASHHSGYAHPHISECQHCPWPTIGDLRRGFKKCQESCAINQMHRPHNWRQKHRLPFCNGFDHFHHAFARRHTHHGTPGSVKAHGANPGRANVPIASAAAAYSSGAEIVSNHREHPRRLPSGQPRCFFKHFNGHFRGRDPPPARP